MLVSIHQSFVGASEQLKLAFLKSPRSAEQRWSWLGVHAQRRTSEETGMPWWLHSWPEAHTGLRVSTAPAKSRCWTQDSQSPQENTLPGCNGRRVLIYASGPVCDPITKSLLSPSNLCQPFMHTSSMKPSWNAAPIPVSNSQFTCLGYLLNMSAPPASLPSSKYAP